MFVIKRNGERQPVMFDKITARISKLCYGLNADFVDPLVVSQKVCLGVYKGVLTSQLDELAAETAAHLTSTHPDYGMLAARIVVSNLQKNTIKSFSENCARMYAYTNPKTGKAAPLLGDAVAKFIAEKAKELDSAIIYDRDYNYDYFGFKTLERAYLLKMNGKIVERPQQMLMRVSAGIWTGDVKKTIETYNLMSTGMFTHASPTLFNSGTQRPQLSSCFLLTMKDDSIEGIYDTLKQCAQISKQAGGIGLSVHKIRATGAYIAGTNGTSNGLVPMLRVFNNTARYVDQGGGKRKGAFAIYLELWHADILHFLELRKNHGIEEHRARDLFYGLWMSDLFMERVEADGNWSLFCPDEAPGLADCWGEKFEKLYATYEAKEGLARKVLKARTLWQAILEAQTETGTPYICYKDACNRKSNQQNLGTIRSSNLCTEIMEYTSPEEVAVCNLASIALPKFVTKDAKTGELKFDHDSLFDVTKTVARNLNRIIDVNWYPIKEAKTSNMRHRPIGIGIQGLADTFMMLHYPFESAEASKLNREILETMYFAACTASQKLAEEDGHYPSMNENGGAPISRGVFQFDLWGVKPDSKRWDWEALRVKVKKTGMRNSLLLAPMPTASTSQILGNNECFEPYTSNIYVRRTLAGEFVCVSRHLLKDLIDLKLWSSDMKDLIVADNGSVQSITSIPKKIRDIHKTVWEMKGRVLIDMAADRGAYICQSQSFNVHMTDVNPRKLTAMHFYAWKKGLKTGMYYLRTKAAADAIKFTVDQEKMVEIKNQLTTSPPPEIKMKKIVVPVVETKSIEPPTAEDIEAGVTVYFGDTETTSGDKSVKDGVDELTEWRKESRGAHSKRRPAFDDEECVSCGS